MIQYQYAAAFAIESTVPGVLDARWSLSSGSPTARPVGGHDDGVRWTDLDPYADAGCLASIWPMASTTASKVSMVEACRAL